LKGKLGRLLQSLRGLPRDNEDLLAIDPALIRAQSLKQAQRLGYPINPNLPLLKSPSVTKDPDAIFLRMLCMNISAACAFGFDRDKGLAWLKQEGAIDALSPKEAEFLESGEGDLGVFKNGVEGVWALAWTLGLTRRFTYEEENDDEFVTFFSDIGKLESSARMKAKVRLRPISECFKQLDLASCLDWAVREAQMAKRKLPGVTHPAVICERLKALQWLLSAQTWDEVAMDA
jgi:hypothetical protein